MVSAARGWIWTSNKFFSERGVHICLLNETHLKSEPVLRLSTYFLLKHYRAEDGGTAIHARRIIKLYAVPFSSFGTPGGYYDRPSV